MSCNQIGGEVARLSCRNCQNVAPSWNGFVGAPRDVQRKSAARPASASCHCRVCKAGRSSTIPTTSAAPELPSECGTPAGTITVWPASAIMGSPFIVKCATPEVMMKRSSWCGWTCSLITPPGLLRQSKRANWPLVVSAVSVDGMCLTENGLVKARKDVITHPMTSARIIPAESQICDSYGGGYPGAPPEAIGRTIAGTCAHGGISHKREGARDQDDDDSGADGGR